MLASYSWSANLAGIKRWRLWRKDDLFSHMLDDHGSFIEEGVALSELKFYEFEQYPGEIVFVPALWPHIVENVTGAFLVGCSIVCFSSFWRRG